MSKLNIVPFIKHFRKSLRDFTSAVSHAMDDISSKESSEYYFYSYTKFNNNDCYNSKTEECKDEITHFTSRLCKIDIPEENNDPIDLFASWLKEAQDRTSFLHAHTMNLATISE